MNRNTEIIDPYKLQRIVLSPISDEMQLDQNYEPPFVRTRETNSQLIVLTLTSTSGNTYPGSGTVSIDRQVTNVNRVRPVYLSLHKWWPNINPRNNVLQFNIGASTFTLTWTPETNVTGLPRYQQLATRMNTAAGTPGNFVASVSASGLISAYDITSTLGSSFRFVNSAISTMVRKGRYLWGFNPVNTGALATTHTLVSQTESYTRYVDILSFRLSEYTKIDISGTNIPAECLTRYYLYSGAYGDYEFSSLVNTGSLNFNRSRGISDVDLLLRDEFGEPIYIPTIAWGSFSFQLSVLAEM